MSLLLRTLPSAAVLRSKPSILLHLPLLHFTLHHTNSSPIKPFQKRACSSIHASSLSPPETLNIPTPKQLVTASIDSSTNALEWNRTAFCGELSELDVGKRVRICGWVALHRVHGGLTFVNIRDHTGIVQITTLPDVFPEAHSVVNDLRIEYVIAVEGSVRQRPSESINKKMKTGLIEVAVEHVQVLNAVRLKLPFLVTTAEDANDFVKEEIRLRYRCLDLRRPQMNSNIMLRHRVVKLLRRYLEDVHDFVEVD